MRILWYSLGSGWFTPEHARAEVIDLRTADHVALAELTSQPYVLFLEPTPYPDLNFDPVLMAERLAAVTRSPPIRLVAFISHPTPVPIDTQCAFTAQIGATLGVTPELQHVVVATRSSRRSEKAKKAPIGDGPVDPGPSVDWQRALDAALTDRSTESLPYEPTRMVHFYIHRSRGRRFSPTQRRLLALAAAGGASVTAAQMGEALNVKPETAQRAIRGIATEFFEEDGRRSPELVGQLVTRYSWFLRYNES